MDKQVIFSGNSVERCEILARHIITAGTTVRATADRFNLSKSTVHKDVTSRLEKINPALHLQVRIILDKNKAERHLRGGYATKVMYERKKSTFGSHIWTILLLSLHNMIFFTAKIQIFT